MAVDGSVLGYGRAGAEEVDGEGDERAAQGDYCDSQDKGGKERAGEMETERLVVARAVGLGDEAGGGHAEKAEGPEDGVEEDAADGYSAEGRRAGEMAGEDGVHCGEQRLGEVGEDEGDREEEDSAVPVGHLGDCNCGGHCRLVSARSETSVVNPPNHEDSQDSHNDKCKELDVNNSVGSERTAKYPMVKSLFARKSVDEVGRGFTRLGKVK